MITRRGKVSLLSLVPCLAFLAFTSREGRTQDDRAVPTDVRVVNPNTAPVQASIVNSVSAPVQTKIVNALGAPVPANIVNPATTPVQAKIVNGSASPVQTSIVGFPVVNAKQNGVWAVNVGNAATHPVPTYDARDGREPFQASLNTTGASFTVPTGKRLVIEYVGLDGFVDGAGILWGTRLQTTSGGVTVFHRMGFTNVGTTGSYTYFQGANVSRIYADPGTDVFFVYNSPGSIPYISASISGYLLPSP